MMREVMMVPAMRYQMDARVRRSPNCRVVAADVVFEFGLKVRIDYHNDDELSMKYRAREYENCDAGYILLRRSY